jgi:hypothetical protein
VRIDRIKKMRLCAEQRAPHLWLLDPMLATLEVYRLEGDNLVVVGVYSETEKVRAEPFEAIEIDLWDLCLK